jgi:hypothetical protein
MRSSLGLSVLLAVCAVAQLATATPVETLGDALLHPSDPNIITLIYEFGTDAGGVVHTVDGGKSWKLGCNSALGGPTRTTSFAMGGQGELYIGSFSALQVDDATRCALEAVSEFDGQWVSDVTAHPDDPDVVLAITSSGGEHENGIWRRTGTGAFQPVGQRQRTLISRVRVTALPDGGERYFETIARGETMELVNGLPQFFANYFVRSSDDAAETWTEHPFPQTKGTLRLELIDPGDPDRLVVSVDNFGEGEADVVLVSDDAGARFVQVAEVEQLGGVALSADGRLWVGDEMGGLFAGALGDVLEVVSMNVRPTCVRFDPRLGRLYLCEDFAFGFYDEPSDALVELFDITQADAFLDCAGVRDEATACEEQMFAGFCRPDHFPGAPICWQSYPDQVPHPDAGGPVARDSGGAGTVGGDAGASGASDANADCGCTAPGAARGFRFGDVLGLLLVLGLRRRRPARPEQPSPNLQQ